MREYGQAYINDLISQLNSLKLSANSEFANELNSLVVPNEVVDLKADCIYTAGRASAEINGFQDRIDVINNQLGVFGNDVQNSGNLMYINSGNLIPIEDSAISAISGITSLLSGFYYTGDPVTGEEVQMAGSPASDIEEQHETYVVGRFIDEDNNIRQDEWADAFEELDEMSTSCGPNLPEYYDLLEDLMIATEYYITCEEFTPEREAQLINSTMSAGTVHDNSIGPAYDNNTVSIEGGGYYYVNYNVRDSLYVYTYALSTRLCVRYPNEPNSGYTSYIVGGSNYLTALTALTQTGSICVPVYMTDDEIYAATNGGSYERLNDLEDFSMPLDTFSCENRPLTAGNSEILVTCRDNIEFALYTPRYDTVSYLYVEAGFVPPGVDGIDILPWLLARLRVGHTDGDGSVIGVVNVTPITGIGCQGAVSNFSGQVHRTTETYVSVYCDSHMPSIPGDVTQSFLRFTLGNTTYNEIFGHYSPTENYGSNSSFSVAQNASDFNSFINDIPPYLRNELAALCGVDPENLSWTSIRNLSIGNEMAGSIDELYNLVEYAGGDIPGFKETLKRIIEYYVTLERDTRTVDELNALQEAVQDTNDLGIVARNFGARGNIYTYYYDEDLDPEGSHNRTYVMNDLYCENNAQQIFIGYYNLGLSDDEQIPYTSYCSYDVAQCTIGSIYDDVDDYSQSLKEYLSDYWNTYSPGTTPPDLADLSSEELAALQESFRSWQNEPGNEEIHYRSGTCTDFSSVTIFT